MLICPRERDALVIHQVGFLAQQRLARGLKLNYSESVGLIAATILELIRDGRTVAELMDIGKQLLGTDDVLEGVPSMVRQVQVEGTFPDGTKLVTVHDPISQAQAPLRSLALRGVFPLDSTPLPANDLLTPVGVPGEVSAAVVDTAEEGGVLMLNEGRRRVRLVVTSFCDRPVQVGSHFHFAEVNPTLEFDRWQAVGMRLDIPAGHSVRFEPFDRLTVTLVEFGGEQTSTGANNLNIKLSQDRKQMRCKFDSWVLEGGFRHKPAAEILPPPPPAKISRALYCRTYGPTLGDFVRLADTQLKIKIEHDFNVYGEEAQFGGGKVLRSGMGMRCNESDVCDLMIVGAVLIDPYLPIVKCDIGIKDGRIRAIGKAGNPDTQPGVHPKLCVGTCTEVVAAGGCIVTAGGVDSHVHFVCPQQCYEAIASGLTTMIGGGTGPAEGTKATTCTPGAWNLRAMYEATDDLPINFGFTGKGSSSAAERKTFAKDLLEQVEAGAIGLKLHEDWGSTPAAVAACLDVADACDVQTALHSDTLNEAGCLEQTLKAIGDRCIHAYHAEGAGGGHAPDILAICAKPNVLPSSTTPTRPFTANTVDEHVDMLMCCHHLSKDLKEDISFAESRIRAETIQAEDVLHDLGAISMMASDSQAMGRIGEVICRTWQTANKNKVERGYLPEDANTGADNFRVRRYLAKYTCNPAIAHGCAHEIGSVSVGKLADLAIWDFAFFGIKPRLVIKGGQIAYGKMGVSNGSIPEAQPVIAREMFGAMGTCPWRNSVLFVSRLSLSTQARHEWQVRKRLVAVQNCRNLSKRDMVLNDVCPGIRVNPQTYEVQVQFPSKAHLSSRNWTQCLDETLRDVPPQGLKSFSSIITTTSNPGGLTLSGMLGEVNVCSESTRDNMEPSPCSAMAEEEGDTSPFSTPSADLTRERAPWHTVKCSAATTVPLAQRYMLF